MKKVLFGLFLLTLGFTAKAQQDYQFTHYMYDKLSFNPGYAGLNKSICGTIIFREQWAGFDGNPTTALINVHSPVKMLRGGLGFTYVSDKLGFESNNLARLSYSYHMGLGVGDLGIGISAGILQKSIQANWITPDGTPAIDDASIAVSGANGLVPDINLGVFYQQNQLYMGISATHLYAPDLTALNISNAKHFWITAGYEYNLGTDLKLRPSILAKSDASSTQLDININVLYKDMIWGGVSYRVSDAIAPMVGYQNNDVGGGTLRIGYAYDVTTSQIKGYSNGSHDIMVNYCFNLEKPKPLQKSKNPRFL
ncbi:type IX secretion system membrane protein PorP/SprF [Flavobacteriales bacterium]|nr:type IX secretion system membrane protein PorP/SprF [Flavobacteriales bacterium]